MQSNATAPTRRPNGIAAWRRNSARPSGFHATISPTTSSDAEQDRDAAPVAHRAERGGGERPYEGWRSGPGRRGSRCIRRDRSRRTKRHTARRAERCAAARRAIPAASKTATPTAITIETPTPGTDEAREAGGEPVDVASIDRPDEPDRGGGIVVRDEEEMRKPEHERADQRHLEREHDVLVAAPEEHEHARDDRRRPRAHADAAHHRAHQERGQQVQQHDHDLIRPVAVQPEDPPQPAIHDDRAG